MSAPYGRIQAADIATVLARHSAIFGTATVDDLDGLYALSFVFAPNDQAAETMFQAVDLFHDLQRLIDLCALQALAKKFDIDVAALLPKE